jgi:hypothetical protein
MGNTFGGKTVETYTEGKTYKFRNPNVRKLFKSGDILLFSGSGVDSFTVKCFTTTVWSHIGMIMKLESFEPKGPKNDPEYRKDPDNLYVWHSTLYSYNGVPDLISGKYKSGVQLNSLTSVMNKYKGRIVIRRLSDPIGNQEKEIIEFMNKYDDRLYEWAPTELANSVCWGRLPDICKSGDNAFFCSELATKTYVDLFHIMKLEKSDEYACFIPEDYASGGLISRHYLKGSVLSGYTLFKESELIRERK